MLAKLRAYIETEIKRVQARMENHLPPYLYAEYIGRIYALRELDAHIVELMRDPLREEEAEDDDAPPPDRLRLSQIDDPFGNEG